MASSVRGLAAPAQRARCSNVAMAYRLKPRPISSKAAKQQRCYDPLCRPQLRQAPNFVISSRSFSQNAPRHGSKFSYRIAASYSGKNSSFNPVNNSFDFNPYNRIQRNPKDKKKRPDSGQDAFFVSRIGETGDVAMGVADGVGGWSDSGVDPADFSHGICYYMAKAAYEHAADSTALTAKALMQRGYENICDDGTVKAGGSTACVALASSEGTVEVANLGDSGFLQLRLNAVRDQTAPQTHAFNTPYQLSIVPAHVRKKIAAFGGMHFADFPTDSSVTRHEVRHGDILIIATDGVWDNLSAQDTLHIVSRLMLGSKAWEHTDQGVIVGKHLDIFTAPEDPEKTDGIPSLQNFLAVGIAGEAKAASTNTKLDGPFAKEVQKHYPEENWKGGKVDDICVVVAVVVEEGKQA